MYIHNKSALVVTEDNGGRGAATETCVLLLTRCG